MEEILKFKNSLKYECDKESLAEIQYIPFSCTHIITHKGDFKKGFFLKDLAREIIGLFGKSFVFSVAEVPLFILILNGIILFLVLISISLIFEWATFLFGPYLILGIVVKELKPQFSYISDYYTNTKCNNCGKEFVCYETEKPDIKEISTLDDFWIQAIHYWKCKSCGYMNVRKSYNDFNTKKGKLMKLSALAKISCKKCGRTNAYIEYKRPDEIKEKYINFEETTRRNYYRCRFCGFNDIKIVKFKEYFAD